MSKLTAYSGTPLPRKLGIRERDRVGAFDAPADFAHTLGETPRGAVVINGPRGKLDIAIAFFTRRRELERKLAALRKAIEPAGALWIAWPKRSSGVETDITEDTIRDVALPTGLVDNKVCAIDDTWSGLRLVVRRELRG